MQQWLLTCGEKDTFAIFLRFLYFFFNSAKNLDFFPTLKVQFSRWDTSCIESSNSFDTVVFFFCVLCHIPYKYRVDRFVLYREAATARSACRASYAASRVGQQSAKRATQIIVMIVTCRKSNKNLPLLQQMPKLLSSDRMQSVYQRNTLSLALWRFSSQMLKSRGRCFLILPDWGYLFYTLQVLNFLTKKDHIVLNKRNVGTKERH